MKQIYPFYDITRYDTRCDRANDHIRFEVETWVRKKHRGKYYLWYVKRSFEYEKPQAIDASLVFMKDLQIFFADVYKVLLFGKIDPKIMHEHYGRTVPLFELDKNQDSEENRLIFKP